MKTDIVVEKPFYLYRKYNAPINLVPLLEGKFCVLPSPSLSLTYLILWILMNSCFTEQLLPGN